MPRLIVPRPIEIPIGPSIAYVPLTQGKFALIDSDDAHEVGARNWYFFINQRGATYAGTNAARCKGETRTFPHMHVFLLNPSKGMVADHVNGNGLDNRRANLREATHQQNCFNSRARKNASGHKGIGWDKRSGRWIAAIQCDGKRKSASFVGIQDAIVWRIAKAKDMHGEFARGT